MKITEFRNKHRFLSNFWPCEVTDDMGITYSSVEHAYQANKSVNRHKRLEISKCDTPGKAKRLGKNLDIRDDWDKVKLEIMYNLVKQKFSKEPLKSMLLDTTGMELVEGNMWGDTFWGVCDGKGENNLGKILMKVRSEI